MPAGVVHHYTLHDEDNTNGINAINTAVSTGRSTRHRESP